MNKDILHLINRFKKLLLEDNYKNERLEYKILKRKEMINYKFLLKRKNCDLKNK